MRQHDSVSERLVRLEAMEYTMRQVKAMLDEGTAAEDVVRSMYQEIHTLQAELEQNLRNRADFLKWRLKNPEG